MASTLSSSILFVALTVLACTSAQGNGCSSSPCGDNAKCRETASGHAVCSCPLGYVGNPFTYCRPAECLDHRECRDMACRSNICVNPCAGACDSNANCEVRDHVAVCL